MESYNNQTINGTYSNDSEGVPLYVSYFIMITSLTLAIIMVTPAITVIGVIWQTRQLHTKYFFFIAHLLATKVPWIILASFLGHLTIILYLLDLNLDSIFIILKWLIIPPFMVIYSMDILLPVTGAVEYMIVIAFIYCHRNILTTKTVVSGLAAMWVVSAILTIIIIPELI